MKKHFLLLLVGIIVFQLGFSQKYWNPADYPAWDAIASNYLVSYGDANFITSKTDIVGTANWGVNWGSRYTVDNSTQSEISVQFTPSATEWSSIQSRFVTWSPTTGAPTETSIKMSDYKLEGDIVDVRQNFIIKGEILIPIDFPYNEVNLSFTGFQIRASVFDAHGHEWNYNGDAIDFIDPVQFGTWAEFSIDYKALALENFDGTWKPAPGDGYSDAFNNMTRPILANAQEIAPIDTAHIVGINFFFQQGQLYSTQSTYTIQLRNISIGVAPSVDITALQLLITSAKDILNGASVGTDIGMYLSADYSEFKDVIYIVEDISTKAGVTQLEIDNALTQLNTAIVTFKKSKIVGPAFYTSKYWKPEEFMEWDAVADNYLAAFAYNTNFVTQKTDIVENAEWIVSYGNRYALNNKDTYYSIDYRPTQNEWASIDTRFATWSDHTGAPTSESTIMSNYQWQGTVVDMRNDFVVQGEIVIPSEFPYDEYNPVSNGFVLRASIVDAHGHEWNCIEPVDTIYPNEFGDWTSFSIDYKKLALENLTGDWVGNLGDGWSTYFNNMPRPILGTDMERAPIDTAHIVAVRFYFNPGQQFINDKVYTIQMRNISVGVPTVATALEKELLYIKIKQANDLLSTAAIGTNTGEYPDAVYYAFKNEVIAAEIVYQNTEASQSMVNTAIAQLQAALVVFNNGQIQPTTLIADCENANTTYLGSSWFSFNDNPSNGLSEVTPLSSITTPFVMTKGGAAGTDYAAKIDYSLFGYDILGYNPFVGFGFMLQSNSKPLDISGSTGCSFWHKGDAVRLDLETADVINFNYYQTIIPAHTDWTYVTVRWNELEQQAWGHDFIPLNISVATAIKWVVSDIDGTSGSVWIDEVQLNGINLYIPVTTFSINKTATVMVGSSVTLTPIFEPVVATNKTIYWTSSNPAIATVDANGSVKGVSNGVVNITAICEDGKIASVCMVTVTDEIVDLTEIQMNATKTVAINEVASIDYRLVPANASNVSLEWNSDNASVVSVDANGKIMAKSVGTAIITITDIKSNISASTVVTVAGSSKPVVLQTPEIIIPFGTSPAYLNLEKYIADDNTDLKDLSFNVSVSSNFSFSIIDGVLGIAVLNNTFIGTEMDTLVVKDADGNSVKTKLFITVSDKINAAPTIQIPNINVTNALEIVAINLKSLIYDDYTSFENLTITVSEPENIVVQIANGTLLVSGKDPLFTGSESFIITAVDAVGATSEATIQYSVNQTTNTAPQVSTIPTQVNSNVSAFQSIMLDQYVVDDYTLPANINWTVSASTKIAIDINNNIATVEIIDNNWTGSETVWFYATDAAGLKDSVQVTYTQTIQNGNGWVGKPYVNFSASKQIVAKNASTTLTAELSGANSWKWIFEGANIANSYELQQAISFAEVGTYDVTLIGYNTASNLYDTVTKANFITIVGIENKDITICEGNSATLTVNASGLTSYQWSTTETGQTITVSPTTTTTYTVIAYDGLFPFSDTVIVHVIENVNLGADGIRCSNDLVLNAGDYDTYKWNKNAALNTATYTAVGVGVYIVEVSKDGCISKDTLTITEIKDALPLDFVSEQYVCGTGLHTIAANVDATSYLWSTNEIGSSIMVSDAGLYSLTVTSSNGCISIDSTRIYKNTPPTPEIGVVTVAEKNNSLLVAWEREANKGIESYIIYREEGNDFDSVGALNFDEISIFIDTTADFRTRAYRYAITAVDACGNESPKSPSHRSIHMRKIVSGTDYILDWAGAGYEGYDNVTYKIYEGSDINNLALKETLGTDYYSYTIPNYNPKYNYRVVVDIPKIITPTVLKNESGPYSQSLSNISESSISSIKEKSSIDMVVYPVPVGDVCNVAIVGNEQVVVSLYNAIGELLQSKTVAGEKCGQVQFEMTHLPQGVYTFVATQANGNKQHVNITK